MQLELVAMAGPAGEEMTVRYRVAATAENGDDNDFFSWGKQRCGPSALNPGPIPSPGPVVGDRSVRSRVIRNLSTRAECLGAIVFAPWMGDGRPLGTFRPYLSAHLAEIMYGHTGAAATVHEGATSALGGDASSYLRSLDVWRTVVDSFRFTVAAPPSATLVGRWQTQGFNRLFRF